ncbi:MAG TPA: EamA family transporter [Pseudacidobacterium sp.]|nr:EamA family transporter [Pseudacidobacterium sp.]
MALHHTGLANAVSIASIIVAATTGDVLIASAMRQIGDLDEIKAHSGLIGAIKAVITNARFFCGVTAMAVSFFSLLFALSHADLSLVAPASASLTVVTNTIAAKIFLKEDVDKRRWIAALCVCAGVVLLAH